MRGVLRGTAFIGALLMCASGAARATLLEPTFLDTANVQASGSVANIGDRPESDPTIPPNDGTHQPGTTVTIPGLLSGGSPVLTTGQFRFDNPGAVSLASIAANWEMRWGIVQVTSVNPPVGTFVTDGSGNQIFPSTVGGFEGFTAFGLGGTQGGSQPPFNTTVEFKFDTAAAGLELFPGQTYVLFALLDKTTNPVPLPVGAGPVPLRSDSTPLDPSQIIDLADGLAGPGGVGLQQLFESQINAGGVPNLDKIVTGVVISAVPEPAGIGLLGISMALALTRRRPRSN